MTKEKFEEFMDCSINQYKKTNNSHIDWEHRRYEIAKDILANLHSSQRTFNYYPNETVEVIEAVRMADLLIKELKKV